MLYTLEEVAKKLKKSIDTIKYYVKTNKLEITYISSRRYIAEEELEKFTKKQTNQIVSVYKNPIITKSGIENEKFLISKKYIAPIGEQIAICEKWIQLFATQQDRFSQWNSYGLKHRVEDWTKEVKQSLSWDYVSNGAFIQAALNLGYKAKQLDSESGMIPSLNCTFNMKFSKEMITSWKYPYGRRGEKL